MRTKPSSVPWLPSPHPQPQEVPATHTVALDTHHCRLRVDKRSTHPWNTTVSLVGTLKNSAVGVPLFPPFPADTPALWGAGGGAVALAQHSYPSLCHQHQRDQAFTRHNLRNPTSRRPAKKMKASPPCPSWLLQALQCPGCLLPAHRGAGTTGASQIQRGGG